MNVKFFRSTILPGRRRIESNEAFVAIGSTQDETPDAVLQCPGKPSCASLRSSGGSSLPHPTDSNREHSPAEPPATPCRGYWREIPLPPLAGGSAPRPKSPGDAAQPPAASARGTRYCPDHSAIFAGPWCKPCH